MKHKFRSDSDPVRRYNRIETLLKKLAAGSDWWSIGFVNNKQKVANDIAKNERFEREAKIQKKRVVSQSTAAAPARSPAVPNPAIPTVAQLQTQLATSQQQVANKDSRIAELTSNLNTHAAEIKSLKTQLQAKPQVVSHPAFAELTGQETSALFDEKTSLNAKLQSDLEEEKRQAATLQEKLKGLEASHTTTTGQNTQLTTENTNLKQQALKLQAELDESSTKASELKSDIERHKKQIVQLSRDLKSAEDAKVAAETESKELKAKVLGLEADLRTQAAELKKAQETIATLQTELSTTRLAATERDAELNAKIHQLEADATRREEAAKKDKVASDARIAKLERMFQDLSKQTASSSETFEGKASVENSDNIIASRQQQLESGSADSQGALED